MASQPTGWMGQQQTATMTNVSGFASPQPQQQQAQPQQQQPQQQQNGDGDKYGASNIFAQMKTGTFAKDTTSAPQAPQKYDALRPQPTGWSPAGVQLPQQPTGFGMGGMNSQMTGMNGMGGMGMGGMGMGMQPQYTAQPGMYGQQQPGQQPQQTGFGGGFQQGGYGYQSY